MHYNTKQYSDLTPWQKVKLGRLREEEKVEGQRNISSHESEVQQLKAQIAATATEPARACLPGNIEVYYPFSVTLEMWLFTITLFLGNFNGNFAHF